MRFRLGFGLFRFRFAVLNLSIAQRFGISVEGGGLTARGVFGGRGCPGGIVVSCGGVAFGGRVGCGVVGGITRRGIVSGGNGLVFRLDGLGGLGLRL